MNPLVAKLDNFLPLPIEDKEALDRVLSKSVRHVAAHKDIVREGDEPVFVYVVLSGWACRYKELKDGRRQIISLILPGDLCDHTMIFTTEVDHSVGAITSTMLTQSPRECVQSIVRERPQVTQALWRETLFSMAAQDEWIVNLGRRDAHERIAHFFCEIFVRQRMAGLTRDNTCQMPLTQAELADAMGLSVVHVNRILQDLRSAELIDLKGKNLTIPDFGTLAQECSFSPNYLCLESNGGNPVARRNGNGSGDSSSEIARRRP